MTCKLREWGLVGRDTACDTRHQSNDNGWMPTKCDWLFTTLFLQLIILFRIVGRCIHSTTMLFTQTCYWDCLSYLLMRLGYQFKWFTTLVRSFSMNKKLLVLFILIKQETSCPCTWWRCQPFINSSDNLSHIIHMLVQCDIVINWCMNYAHFKAICMHTYLAKKQLYAYILRWTLY